MKVIFYRGREYRSIKELCDTYGVDASLFRYYKNTKGMSVNDSMERCLHSKPRCNSVTYNGITYLSESEMCDSLGVDYSKYLKRKGSGKTLEECLSPGSSRRGRRGNGVCYRGKVYHSAKELCDTYGVKAGVFWYYNNVKGMSVEDSMKRCLYPDKSEVGRKGKEICYQGKVYRSMQELCDAYGIKAVMFSYYNSTKGMSVEDSVERCLNPVREGNSITYKGITYASESEMCYRLGVKYNTYMKRKSSGKTLEECLSIDKEERGRKGNEVYYQGRVYKSEKALCEARGVNYNSYLSRKSSGKTLEECLSTDESNKSNEICYQGKVYKSGRALCEAHGVSYSTYRSRRKKGYTVEESLKPANRGTDRDMKR